MKISVPGRWILWSGLSAVLWLSWAVWGQPMLSDRLREQRQSRDEAQTSLAAMQAKLEAVPQSRLVIDSAMTALEDRISQFAAIDSLDDLLDNIRERAGHYGVVAARVEPVIDELLALRSAGINSTTSSLVDTLALSVEFQGGYAQVGRLLDEIEQRADFQYWEVCRWFEGSGDDYVQFVGRFGLIVARPNVTVRTPEERYGYQ